MRRTTARRRTLAAATALVGLLGAIAAAPTAPAPGPGDLVAPSDDGRGARAVPDGYEYFDAWYPSHDGVMLHAGVYLPADREPGEQHPPMVSITPYTSPNGGATGAGFADDEIPVRFPELFDHPRFVEDRWAYVAVDVRGFGGSGGCFQYYGNDEFLDTRATIDWAGTQEWSTGRVALWGKSYDAAQMVLALGSGSEHLAATVIQAPGLSGYTALWHNGVHYATGRYATTSVYLADDLFPPASAGSATSPEYALSNVDGAQGRPECARDWQGMNLIGDRDDPYWADKEPYREAMGSEVPSLWHWGFHDANTKFVGLDVFESLTGPKQAWFGQWTHVRGHEPQVGRDGFLDEAFRFLDVHVLGRPDAGAGDPPVTVQSGGPDGEWRREESWPPADVATWTMPLNPGTYLDEPEALGAEGFWSTTPELPHDVHVAGAMAMTVQATTVVPGAHLVARVYDLDEDGNGQLVHRGAVALPAAGENGVTFELYPQDFHVPAGHRIAVLVNASEDGWYSPGTTGTTVEVTSASLDLPLLTEALDPDDFLLGDPSDMSSAGSVRLDAATIEDAEVEGAVPPAMR